LTLLAGEALRVAVAGFLPQHAGLRGRVAVGGDVLPHRCEDVNLARWSVAYARIDAAAFSSRGWRSGTGADC
jgi:hypothetical protein